MKRIEKSFYVPVKELEMLYESADLGESKEITVIVYPHREEQLEKLNCKKFVIIEEIEKLKQENKKLREALEFYANSENWCQLVNGQYNMGKIWVYQEPDNKYMNNSITLECGAHARKTLREIDEKN